MSVDPLADNYPSYSPYNYTLNNPINLNDPDGCSVTGGVLVADLAFPDPTDLIPWKWVGYGAAFVVETAAILIINEMTEEGASSQDSGDDSSESNNESKEGERERSNPFKGESGSTSETKDKDGNTKQTRKYAEDGYPDYDIDYDHHDGPHKHDWDRPKDGSPPTHENRKPGEPVTQDEIDKLLNQ